jgi:hypothetical protein
MKFHVEAAHAEYFQPPKMLASEVAHNYPWEIPAERGRAQGAPGLRGRSYDFAGRWSNATLIIAIHTYSQAASVCPCQ